MHPSPRHAACPPRSGLRGTIPTASPGSPKGSIIANAGGSSRGMQGVGVRSDPPLQMPGARTSCSVFLPGDSSSQMATPTPNAAL